MSERLDYAVSKKLASVTRTTCGADIHWHDGAGGVGKCTLRPGHIGKHAESLNDFNIREWFYAEYAKAMAEPPEPTTARCPTCGQPTVKP